MSSEQRRDTEATEMFEIISTFFVDIFFNQIYITAERAFKNGDYPDITSAYQNTVSAFSIDITSKKSTDNYKKLMNNLHNYFQKYARFTYVRGYGDFVDGVVRMMVPEEYFRNMKEKERDEVISVVICTVIKFYAKSVTKTDTLRKIIDMRQDRAAQSNTIYMLQDSGVTIIFQLRDSLYNRFIGASVNAPNSENPELVAKLKGAIRKLAKEKAEFKSELDARDSYIEQLENQMQEVSRKYKKLKSEKKALESAIGGGQTQPPVVVTPPTQQFAAQPVAQIVQQSPAVAQSTESLPSLGMRRRANQLAAPPSQAEDFAQDDDPFADFASSAVSGDVGGGPSESLIDDMSSEMAPGDFSLKSLGGR